MTLTAAQLATLRDAAQTAGLDPAELIAAAEEEASAAQPGKDLAGNVGQEKPTLFAYHLPFIRVRELRKNWLDLDESLENDEMTCGEFEAWKASLAPPKK